MKWFSNFGLQRRNRELQEEIDAHLQMAIADRVARGEAPGGDGQVRCRQHSRDGTSAMNVPCNRREQPGRRRGVQ